MSCFSCITSRGKDASRIEIDNSNRFSSSSGSWRGKANFDGGSKELYGNGSEREGKGKSGKGTKSNAARSFAFRELAAASRGFREVNVIGEGGFGRVYKGVLETGQVVAIKQLSKDGIQGNQEFVVEVLMLSMLHHPNLVTLIGYCAEGDQRLLVYEYMTMGSLENHLFDLPPDKEPLSWSTRINIALGAAQGLEYLHCKANPPVIYRDLKSANILLDKDFNPKLSDFGLAKLGPVGDNTHVSTRVMGTYGYCAPEYAMSGKLTLKSDIYSFGVVLLELITGRKAIDICRRPEEQNLVTWSRQFIKDKRKFVQLVDPLLQGHFPSRCLHHAIAVTAMCLQEQPMYRPLISDIVVALEYLASQSSIPESHKVRVHHPPPQSPPRKESSFISSDTNSRISGSTSGFGRHASIMFLLSSSIACCMRFI